MQKTAKKAAVIDNTYRQFAADVQAVTGITPYVSNVTNPLRQVTDATYQQWSNMGQSYQPTITWQDTTSNATYSSASSVLNST